MESNTEGNQTKKVHNALSLTRLERITDIFYAFALLILTYTFADIPDNLSSSSERWGFYFTHLETFTGFFISFFIVAYYWINHQEYFSFITTTDKVHTFIELVYLMILVFMPYMNRFYEMYPDAIEPRILLSIDMIVLGLLQYFSWSYATKNRRLVGETNPSDETIKAIRSGMLLMPTLALIAAVSVFIYPYLWEIILVVSPIVLTARKKMKTAI